MNLPQRYALGLKFVAISLLIFIASFHVIVAFNEVKQKELSFSIRSKVNLIYDELHSFTKYYINSEDVLIERGIHQFYNVGVVNTETKIIKKFSTKLNLLSKRLKKLGRRF